MENETEKLKNNSDTQHKNGGARPGAGRKKGGMNAERKVKLMKLNAIKKRIQQSAQMLLDSQLSLAKGVSQLYHIYYEGEGKEKTKIVEVVEDQHTIEAYFKDELDEDEYYYITTKVPDNRAISNLLDRAFGRPKETMELNDKRKRRILKVEIIDGRQIDRQIPSDTPIS